MLARGRLSLHFQIKRCAGKKQEGKAKDGAEAAKQGKPAGDAGSFNQVTEAASTLMDAGELDIYSMSREVGL